MEAHKGPLGHKVVQARRELRDQPVSLARKAMLAHKDHKAM